jgi:hypothetical protein
MLNWLLYLVAFFSSEENSPYSKIRQTGVELIILKGNSNTKIHNYKRWFDYFDQKMVSSSTLHLQNCKQFSHFDQCFWYRYGIVRYFLDTDQLFYLAIVWAPENHDRKGK